MIEKLPEDRDRRAPRPGTHLRRHDRPRGTCGYRLNGSSRKRLAPHRLIAGTDDETWVGIFWSERETHFSRNGAFPGRLHVPLYFQERLRKAKEQEEVIHARHCYPTLGTLDRNRTWKPSRLSRPSRSCFSSSSFPPPPSFTSLIRPRFCRSHRAPL